MILSSYSTYVKLKEMVTCLCFRSGYGKLGFTYSTIHPFIRPSTQWPYFKHLPPNEDRVNLVKNRLKKDIDFSPGEM